MMWMGLLKSHEVKFTFLRFLKLGVLPSLIALGAALFGLFIVLL